MAQLAAGRVLVGTPAGHVLVRVEGRGTHMNSQPLHAFAQEMVKRGYRDFDLDLSACLYVDSTFAGVIVGLSLHVRETLGGHVSLFGANPRCREQLHTLGVAHLFELAQEGVRPDSDDSEPTLQALPAPYTSLEQWAGTIVDAHETLARIDPSNARLQEVVEYMLQKKPQLQ